MKRLRLLYTCEVPDRQGKTQESQTYTDKINIVWQEAWQDFASEDVALRDIISIHFNWKEGNVLFNDALNTFYLRLYGVRHMVKDHSNIEKGNPLLPHRLLLSINSKGSFICTIPQTG